MGGLIPHRESWQGRFPAAGSFRADRPNELWVVDFTYVPTWSGMAFTASVTDVVSRRIVGWRKLDPIPTDIPLDALEMALWVRDRAGQDITGVIQHSDAGVQYIAIRCCWSDCNGRACGDNLDDRARLI